MDLKRLIPGLIAIATIIVFFTGVYSAASSDQLNTMDCEKCHQGNEPMHSAEHMHLNAGFSGNDCAVCHTSVEEAHMKDGIVFSDCMSCHTNEPHESIPASNCVSCHNDGGTTLEVRNHDSLQCTVCHVQYQSYVPDCTNCHGSNVHADKKAVNDEFIIRDCVGCHGPVHKGLN